MADDKGVSSGRRARSPSYPGIGLREAVARAKVLYDAEKRAWAHVDTVLQHWRYKPRSGGGLVVLAALKSFGLLAAEGSGASRRARLSDIGLKLLLLDEDEHAAERRQLLKEAALRPRIHADLWRRYQGSLPSDATMRLVLLTDLSFTENAVKEFIPQFRDTVAYAGLTAFDRLTRDDADTRLEDGETGEARRGEEGEVASGVRSPAPRSATSSIFSSDLFGKPKVTPPTVTTASAAPSDLPDESGVLQFPIPLPGTDQLAALQVPRRMTEAAWTQMLAIINAYKPSIVQPARQQHVTEMGEERSRD